LEKAIEIVGEQLNLSRRLKLGAQFWRDKFCCKTNIPQIKVEKIFSAKLNVISCG